MGGLGHGVRFEHGGVVGLFEGVEDGWRERGGAGADEADVGERGGGWVLEEDLVHCRHGCVPVCAVGGEVAPEVGGGELGGHDHRSAREEGREQATEELINKGGEKISPIELDNVLARHPAVAEAVSFAVPDDMYGQDVGVAVVLKSGGEGARLSEGELKAWVAEKLAKFKVPKKVSPLYTLLLYSIYFSCSFFFCSRSWCCWWLTLTVRSTSPMSCPRRRRARSSGGSWPRPCRSRKESPSCRDLFPPTSGMLR